MHCLKTFQMTADYESSRHPSISSPFIKHKCLSIFKNKQSYIDDQILHLSNSQVIVVRGCVEPLSSSYGLLGSVASTGQKEVMRMATVVCWGLGGVTLAHSVWEGRLQPTVCLYITHSVSVCYIRICCQRKLFSVSSGCYVFERLLPSPWPLQPPQA